MNVSRDFASVNSNSFDSSALEVDSRLISDNMWRPGNLASMKLFNKRMKL